MCGVATENADATPAVHRWTVDVAAPVVDPPTPAPGSAVRDRTPTIGAGVRDPRAELKKSDIDLYLDGREIGGFSCDGPRDRLTYTPGSNLAFGSHAVRVVARDAAGNAASRSWGFRVTR